VLVPSKRVPHFKAGKELRERVDSGAKRSSGDGSSRANEAAPAGIDHTS
jgi:integration host factor subunit beta